MKGAVCALALLLGAVASLSADIGPPTDIASRSRGAQRVVLARVLDMVARFDTNRFGDQLIVSDATVEVLETLKGSTISVLRVAVEGGTVGDLTLTVSDMPSLHPGDRVVFFLDAERAGVHTPHDRGRGVLKLSAGDRVEGSAITLDAIRRQVRAVGPQGVR
jgi:hypothetical protein